MRDIVRVAVIGSRSITDKDYVFSVLDFYLRRLLEENEVIVISGGALGIDAIAEQYAEEKGLKTEIYKPDYTAYSGKIAPIKRNQTIVDNSDYLIGITTGSSGTASTIKMAEKKGIPIKIITV